MKSIKIYHKSANEIIEIVQQLKVHGWKLGIDFDWSYHKATYNFVNPSDEVTPKHAIFTFYKEEYSTYFVLKWA